MKKRGFMRELGLFLWILPGNYNILDSGVVDLHSIRKYPEFTEAYGSLDSC